MFNADTFIEDIAPAAQEVCVKYLLPPSVCIAQAILESGWGEYVIGKYNLFGHKWNGKGRFIKAQTFEYDDEGNRYEVVAKFQDYDTLEEAIEDWCVVISQDSEYTNAYNTWNETLDVEQFVQELAKVYATDPEYAENVMDIIKSNDLLKYDAY